MYIPSQYHIYLFIVGAVIGAAKMSTATDEHKPLCDRCCDIGLGIFSGVIVALEVKTRYSVWLCGLISMGTAAVATLAVEVMMAMVGDIVRIVINKPRK